MAAGDFTNVRVESRTDDSATIRYSYAGAGDIALYRSTDGVSYSSVQSIPAAYGSYPTIVDITVSPETLYYYKFTDDAGSTFSSAVTVKTQKKFLIPIKENKTLTMKSFDNDESVNAANVDAMRADVENYLNSAEVAPVRKNCKICPDNGALVLDCYDGCFSFTVARDDITDINSISINCDVTELFLDIPEGTPVEICGWGADAGFGGDECYEAPVSGPIDEPIAISPPYPCPVTHTYHVGAPCKGDYIYECYSKGSLDRISGSRGPSVVDCNCGTIGDGNRSYTTTDYVWMVRSGKKIGLSTLDQQPMAGFSLLYKSVNSSCAGAPGTANIYQYTIGGFGSSAFSWAVQGKPMFGFAVNVPVGVSMRSFTGNVLLFDHINSRFIWGSYANADLLSGALPTIVDTLAMSVIVPTQISLIVDATPGNVYSLYDVVFDNDTQTELMNHTSISTNGEPTGAGIFWIGNSTYGNHNARLSIKQEQVLTWWG